jgi:hypothetical protein
VFLQREEEKYGRVCPLMIDLPSRLKTTTMAKKKKELSTMTKLTTRDWKVTTFQSPTVPTAP